MTRIVFENNAAWEEHLAEIRAEKAEAWREGLKAGYRFANRPSDSSFDTYNPYLGVPTKADA